MTSNNAPAATPPATDAADREIVHIRDLDAPRSLVWQALTSPDHLVHWWGPAGFTTTSLAIDIRPGGHWRFIMHGPDGKDYPNLMTFDEVVEPDRLTYAHGSGEDDPDLFRVEVTLADLGGRTRLTKRSVFPTAEACAAVKAFGAVELGYSSLDCLAAELAKMVAE